MRTKTQIRTYQAKYYQAHKAEAKVKATKWAKENPERRKEIYNKSAKKNYEKHKVWVSNNKEKRAAAAKKWREKNRKLANERIAEWGRKNPEARRAIAAKRRTTQTNAGGYFTAAEWKDLCASYNNLCLCCGKSRKLTADHVIPVSKGGTSNINNIQPLCGPCNSKKSTGTTDFRKFRTQNKTQGDQKDGRNFISTKV